MNHPAGGLLRAHAAKCRRQHDKHLNLFVVPACATWRVLVDEQPRSDPKLSNDCRRAYMRSASLQRANRVAVALTWRDHSSTALGCKGETGCAPPLLTESQSAL